MVLEQYHQNEQGVKSVQEDNCRWNLKVKYGNLGIMWTRM